MTPRRLLLLSLLHHRGVHAAVALGVAVGAAVLAGALIVGASVRGSLRGLTLDRLGAIDFAFVGERYFREAVREAVSGEGRTASAGILIRGSAEHAESGARASKVRLHGVDDAFWNFFADLEPPAIGNRDVLLNRTLAAELGAAEGDDVLLRFQTDTLIPAESVMGRKSDNVRLMRLRVASVLEDAGPGRFGLSPRQQLPYNAFVAKAALERALDRTGRANALFVAGGTQEETDAAWREAFSPADAALAVRSLDGGRGFQVESERIVLDPAAAAAILDAAAASGVEPTQTLTYLANRIEAGGRSVPYSTVTALEAWPESLRLANGEPAPPLGQGEILLNRWAADDLGVRAGDTATLAYYVIGADSALATETSDFRVAGIVRMAGAALDRDYAPTYKGMSDKERMASWDPPFPVDLRLIRPRDEDYWDRYRAAPKAFASLADAKRLWTSRFGQLTSIRLAVPPGEPVEEAAERFRAALRERLDPADFGLAFEPVKRIGLEAASGATDFAGLFLGFSMFLIASAAILVALLFRLGVERRSREVGLLLAAGHAPGFVRNLLLGEGAALAAAGCLLGLPGAVGYAKLMLYGLNTWWSGAIGASFLSLHVRSEDLAAGAIGTLGLMLASIWLALRRLKRLAPRALLAGSLEPARETADPARQASRLRRAAAVAAVLAAGLLGLSAGIDSAARLGAFFGAGALALTAALVFFRALLLAPRGEAAAVSGLWRLGVRNSSRNGTRSVLSAALMACASFMIVTVAMNRQDVSGREPAFQSGDGGFRLIAEADLPLFQGRLDSFSQEREEAARLFPLRRRAGEDASCLNLYRPAQPSLAGAPDALIRRGGFAFQQTLAATDAERENPWLLLAKDFDGAVPVFGDANSVTWILHLALGEEIKVRDGSGRERRLILAGLFSRSIFQSELILAERRFLELYPDHSGYQTLLVETGTDETAAALEDAFADEGLDATRTADRLASYLVVENTYLSTFRTLGGLGLLLGTLGLAVVMVRSALERRGELALLQALGFSPSSIARLIFAENSFLLLFGVGAGTAAALLAVAPHLASGLADPPWLPLAATLGAIVGLGLLAGSAAAAVSLRAAVLPGLRGQ